MPTRPFPSSNIDALKNTEAPQDDFGLELRREEPAQRQHDGNQAGDLPKRPVESFFKQGEKPVEGKVEGRESEAGHDGQGDGDLVK